MKFKQGQEVALREPAKMLRQHNPNLGIPTPPKASEIYHVSFYEPGKFLTNKGLWYIGLAEMPSSGTWGEEAFEPIISTEVLEKELELEPQTV